MDDAVDTLHRLRRKAWFAVVGSAQIIDKALYRVNGKIKPDRDMLVVLIRKISIKHNGEFTIEWNFDRKFKPVDGSYVKGAKKI